MARDLGSLPAGLPVPEDAYRRTGRIEHVFHPVFPPDRHAEEVLARVRRHPG
jgi:hypothetical protein